MERGLLFDICGEKKSSIPQSGLVEIGGARARRLRHIPLHLATAFQLLIQAGEWASDDEQTNGGNTLLPSFLGALEEGCFLLIGGEDATLSFQGEGIVTAASVCDYMCRYPESTQRSGKFFSSSRV